MCLWKMLHERIVTETMTSCGTCVAQVQVDLHLALGTLIKNPLFEEVEPELQHLAWFKTIISLRNALQVGD